MFNKIYNLKIREKKSVKKRRGRYVFDNFSSLKLQAHIEYEIIRFKSNCKRGKQTLNYNMTYFSSKISDHR